MWQKELFNKFPQLKMELGQVQPNAQEIFTGLISKGILGKVKYAIYLPHMPDKDTQAKIKEIIPVEFDYQYVETIKPSVIEQVRFLLQQAGFALAKTKVDERHLEMQASMMGGVEADETAPFWDEITKEFYNDGFLDSWKIVVGETKRYWNRKVMDEVGRRVEIEPITNDTLSDLTIALNVTEDVNDFLAVIEGRRPLLIKKGK